MLSIIFLIVLPCLIGYKFGRSYGKDWSPALVVICAVVFVAGLCFCAPPSEAAVICMLLTCVSTAGIVDGILCERRQP